MTVTGFEFRRVRGVTYELTQPLSWRIGGPNVEHLIEIPAGFRFDSSVPRWLWWVLSPHDPRFLLSACVHDFILTQGYGRTQAAGDWHDATKKSKAPPFLSGAAYLAVAFWAVAHNPKD